VTHHSTNGTNHTFETAGPGFIYSWEDDSSPISITPIPDGEHPVQVMNGQQLVFIGSDPEGLKIQIPDRPAQIIKVVEQSVQQQLGEILNEVRHASVSRKNGPCDSLITIIFAQRLVALGCHICNSSEIENKPERSPAKARFASDLHEWFARELENSVKLDHAAKHFKKSPRQLIRILKDTTGAGFSEHLTMHRLILARKLLMRTDTSIMEVAKRSGFNSREQFIRSFNKAFSWTPLQFRKAWNKASLSNGELEKLCQISDRQSVAWQKPGSSLPASVKSCSPGCPQTLVVANSLHEIIELFSIDDIGRRARISLLDRGSMIFVSLATSGSCWLVRVSSSGRERKFTTPDDHSIAVVGQELIVPKKQKAAG
jgi:AraC-like DNA-binding protein